MIYNFFDKNKRGLQKLHNIHVGKRAFIVANGPGLRIEDLHCLKNEITFASNKIYLAYEKTDWRPTYYTVIDSLVAEQNVEDILSVEQPKLFGHATRHIFDGQGKILFGEVPPEGANPSEWSPIKGTRTGHSVLYWDLKLAYWMGIREVYATGLDFHFDVPDSGTGEKAMGNDVILGTGESNHFDPNYRSVGEKWTFPKMDEQRSEFSLALEKFKSDGGCIYNASRVTKLDVWPLVDFDTLFES